MKYLLRIGVPLVLSTSCYTFALSMDRLFIAKNFGAFELGLYQFASIVFLLGSSLAGIIAQWMSPQILFNHGRGTEPAKSFSLVLSLMGGIAALFLVGYYPFSIFASILIERFFPRYVDAIPFLAIFYFAASLTVINLSGVMINVLNKQLVSLGWTIFVTLVLFMSYLITSWLNVSLIVYAGIFLSGQILFVSMNIGLGFWFVRKVKPNNI